MKGECVGGPLDGKTISSTEEVFSIGINYVRGEAVVGSVEHIYMREGRQWLCCLEVRPRREPFTIVPALQEQVERMKLQPAKSVVDNDAVLR